PLRAVNRSGSAAVHLPRPAAPPLRGPQFRGAHRMASHRRTKAATRAVLSLAATTTAVGAAGVVLAPAPSHAASTADIKSQIATLDAQAEQATNAYDQAVEQLAQLQKQVDALQGQAAETRASMAVLMKTLGPIAAQQYRSDSIDPQLELLLNGT